VQTWASRGSRAAPLYLAVIRNLDDGAQTCIHFGMDGFEWDAAKAAANLAKHKVDFADAALSLEDPRALTISDPDAIAEERFVTLAADPTGRILITAYSYSGTNRRIISARKASPGERKQYEAR
jgi:uncharacterized protein